MNSKERFDSTMWSVITGVICVLFAGNVFWAKRTVDRLDEIQSKVYELSEHVALIQQQIGTISSTRAKISLPSQSRKPSLQAAEF